MGCQILCVGCLHVLRSFSDREASIFPTVLQSTKMPVNVFLCELYVRAFNATTMVCAGDFKAYISICSVGTLLQFFFTCYKPLLLYFRCIICHRFTPVVNSCVNAVCGIVFRATAVDPWCVWTNEISTPLRVLQASGWAKVKRFHAPVLWCLQEF